MHVETALAVDRKSSDAAVIEAVRESEDEKLDVPGRRLSRKGWIQPSSSGRPQTMHRPGQSSRSTGAR